MAGADKGLMPMFKHAAYPSAEYEHSTWKGHLVRHELYLYYIVDALNDLPVRVDALHLSHDTPQRLL